MPDKFKSVIDFLAGYPPWVVILSSGLFVSALCLLVIYRPKPAQTVSGNGRSMADFNSSSAVLVVSARQPAASLSDLATIQRTWPGPVSAVSRASREQFLDAIKKGYAILHIEAPVLNDSLEFEDGPLSATTFREVLSIGSSKTRLVVLSACQSFRIGKALEGSHIRYSVVAVPNLRADVAATFYEELYKELSVGTEAEEAYERAILMTNVKYAINAREVLMFTKYGVANDPERFPRLSGNSDPVEGKK